jgi:hypothetical protein
LTIDDTVPEWARAKNRKILSAAAGHHRLLTLSTALKCKLNSSNQWTESNVDVVKLKDSIRLRAEEPELAIPAELVQVTRFELCYRKSCAKAAQHFISGRKEMTVSFQSKITKIRSTFR